MSFSHNFCWHLQGNLCTGPVQQRRTALRRARVWTDGSAERHAPSPVPAHLLPLAVLNHLVTLLCSAPLARIQGCHLLSVLLEELGIAAAALHSHKPQRARLAALDRFKSGAGLLWESTLDGFRGLQHTRQGGGSPLWVGAATVAEPAPRVAHPSSPPLQCPSCWPPTWHREGWTSPPLTSSSTLICPCSHAIMCTGGWVVSGWVGGWAHVSFCGRGVKQACVHSRWCGSSAGQYGAPRARPPLQAARRPTHHRTTPLSACSVGRTARAGRRGWSLSFVTQ